MIRKTKTRDIREVFLPAGVVKACFVPEAGQPAVDWENLHEDALFDAVGQALEHGFWHWRWLSALRRHRCKLVVVQSQDARGEEVYPHYQIGELFTLSQWHPERAVAEAERLLEESDGDGMTVGLPADSELVLAWDELAADQDLEADTAVEVLASAMILLDDAHDRYVEELGDGFFIASRGSKRDLELLLADEDGKWSAETVQIVDRAGTARHAHIFREQPDYLEKPVPVMIQPVVPDEEDELDDVVPDGPLN